MSPESLAALAPRFWAKVAKSSACWMWLGAKRGKGYGAFYPERRKYGQRAHRVAWLLVRGAIPKGIHVLHECDVRLCVNPDHLFLGTNRMNVADKVAKGRQTKGEDFPQAKLTEIAVADIKARIDRGAVQAQLAREYGVGNTAINNIALGRKWKHVSARDADDGIELRPTGS